jgi:hypothetical protein
VTFQKDEGEAGAWFRGLKAPRTIAVPCSWNDLFDDARNYQVEFLRAYLDVAARKPLVAGLHVWNFADFKTGPRIIRMGGISLKGVFTRDRRPKMAAHFLRSRWVRSD